MGSSQRGVHFGAVSQKRGEERSKFSIANFLAYFCLTLYQKIGYDDISKQKQIVLELTNFSLKL
jgi:hypothetical protein